MITLTEGVGSIQNIMHALHSMIHFIEEAFQVNIYNVVVPRMNVLLCLLYHLVGISIWEKAVAVFFEL